MTDSAIAPLDMTLDELRGALGPLLPQEAAFDGWSEAALAAAEVALGVALPADYRAFLLQSNGYDGPVGGGADVAFWPIDVVVSSTTGYDGAEELGLVLIGSNGGPTAYGFDHGGLFVSVPFMPMVAREVRVIGVTWAEFLQALAAGEGW